MTNILIKSVNIFAPLSLIKLIIISCFLSHTVSLASSVELEKSVHFCPPLTARPEQNLDIYHTPRNPLEYALAKSTSRTAHISCQKYFEFSDEFKYNGSQLTWRCTKEGWSGPGGENFEDIKCQIKCGTPVRDNTNLLTNGSQLDWPWHVGIFRDNSYLCAGTLITSPTRTHILVLTAAHCFGKNQMETPELFKIVIGEVTEKIQDSDRTNSDESLQIFNVSHISIPFSYNDGMGAALNDIALLTTVEPIVPTDYSIPVCLPRRDLPDFDERSLQSGLVTGFELKDGGTQYHGSKPGLIKYRALLVQRQKTDVCDKILSTNLSDSQWCAGNHTKARIPCVLDRRGFGIIFQVPRGDENSTRYTIQGVENVKVGNSRMCIHAYTKVHSHIQWIHSESEELLARKARIDLTTTPGPPLDSENTTTTIATNIDPVIFASKNIPHTGANFIVPISVIVIVLILTVGSTTLCWRIYLHRQVKISNDEFNEFINGHRYVAGQLSSNSIHLNTLPYEQGYEIKEKDLKIDQANVLGYGTYGVVFKGTYRGEPVAVKTLKAGAEKEYLMALLSELKIMIYLDKHLNLVSLVGAHTKFVQRGILHIVVDLCENGNLTTYLHKHRDSFEEDCFEGIQTRESSASVGNIDSETRLSTRHLLRWSYQISSAMEYLESKKVVHADLAARNVLLTENLIAKVSDFGLSRKLYEHMEYVKKHKEPMPWKWMAPESLQMLQFSSQSDVWSFGVTIWEMFTLGDNPYPGLSYSVDFPMRLTEGLRLYKPPYASNAMFELMQLCWSQSPHNRPTFQVIKTRIMDILNTHFNLEEYTHLEFC